MKLRWKIALGIAGAGLIAIAAPIAFIETRCSAPFKKFDAGRPYTPILERPVDHRPEARTWLTYPEWYIVYSAESLGGYLAAGERPSAFPYGRHIAGFWKGYCALNRAAAGSQQAGDAKVMIYTIGISYSAELAVKALYEITIGRTAEAISGWTSADDRYAAKVQQRYGAFMHETPWYAFPFPTALSRLWAVREPDAWFRHWERRGALSAEYGVKAVYAKAIGWLSGATLGRDERTLRMVMTGTPDAIRAIDPRLKVLGSAGPGRVIVEAPRYAQFTDLVGKLAGRPERIVEIAGNDDIFVTLLAPNSLPRTVGMRRLVLVPIEGREGWSRMGMTVKVAQLQDFLAKARADGARLEHVYDY